MTEMGPVYRSAEDFAVEAVHLALEDAGLDKSQLDGLLINAGVTQGIDVSLQRALGLRELDLLTFMQGYGSSAGQMVQYAAMAVNAGLANVVCCMFADDPLQEGQRAGAAYAGGRRTSAPDSLRQMYGWAGPIAAYASGARRHTEFVARARGVEVASQGTS